MTKRQATAFSLRLEGYTYAQIAEKTAWSEFSLRKYFSPKGKWYQKYETWREDAIKFIETETRIRLKRNLDHAITVLEYALTLAKTNPAVALRAAEKIMDLNGFTPYNAEDVRKTQPLEDRAEKLAQWFEHKNKT